MGYLNNLNSDRALIRYCSNCLDIRLFLGYDLNEELPWHSTISRTRGLFGEELFLSLFQQGLQLCVEKGMVRGKRQAIDSAFMKANASMDSLLEKEVLENASAYVGYTRFLVKRRSSTVEPVLGTLINFLGMKRVNTRGMKNANKHVLMSALSYNLKKFLKSPGRKIKAEAQMMNLPKGKVQDFWKLFSSGFNKPNLSLLNNQLSLPEKTKPPLNRFKRGRFLWFLTECF